MIELEKTYLLKHLPKGVLKCRHKEIVDIYWPKNVKHPHITIKYMA